ncbi:IclR family transcriptional regulator [Streptomyces montanisoli]|uniref:Glycerol operon regulatory protein n=1 Tax=Streptomyces montanisoli TaxID=2798581 RepID=A0A940RXV7_9ACTN|nr:IclR family transcriptional regulator [Streptomyces montanisoli]MBP0460731.1 IclR family transcriptional regulator [Streptomyces montanisoli]
MTTQPGTATHPGTTAQPGTETAGRVIDVLLLFTDGPDELGVSAIARELGLSKAVVHRILQTLVGRGMVALDQESRLYRLGPSAAALGARALREFDLRAVAAATLRRLQADTGETVTLSALVPGGRAYVDQIVSTHEVKMTVELGRRFPLHAGSSGKCCLAHLPEPWREEILAASLPALTDTTPTDPGDLRAELAGIRELGYASSHGERQSDAGSVASPLFGLDGDVRGAVSVCGPRSRVTPAFIRDCAPRVVEAARDISAALGWTGESPAGRRGRASASPTRPRKDPAPHD